MKKIFSLLVCVMLAAALSVPSFAIKTVTDNFENGFNPNIWCEGSIAEIFDGKLEDYSRCVLTLYEDDLDEGGFLPGPTCLFTFTTGIDFMCEDDGDESHSCGLWISDCYDWLQGVAADRNTFAFMYHAPTSRFVLLMNTENPELEEADLSDTQKILAEWEDPRGYGWNLECNKWINIGLKVEEGKLSCYVDGDPVIVYDGPEVSGVGKSATPLVLWNNKCHVMWDNFWMGDLAEYPEALVTDPVTDEEGKVVTNESGNKVTEIVTEPQTTRIETEIVTEFETKMADVTDEEGNIVTDEEGNKVTEVVTEVVTRVEEHVVTNAPAPDTQKQPTNPQGGAQTGDMAFIVIAAMIASLGAAVVVKKVSH